MAKDRVVAMMLRKEIITPAQAKRAWQHQQNSDAKEALWRVVSTLPDVTSEEIFAEAARVYAFKTAKTGEGKPDPEFARSVMETFPDDCQEELLKMRVVPMECDLETKTGAIKLVFITHDPMRPEVNKIMQRLKLERFELQYAPEGLMNTLIAEAFPKRNEFLERMQEGGMAFDLGTSYDESGENLIDEGALEAEISSSKLLNLFEATLVEAVRQGASDVHIYPNADKKVEIHFRVDGRLSCWHREDKVHPEALLAVIKDNTINVDRFERDAAQDGFIQRWIDDTLIRFRVSVLPIANAIQEMRSESIVIRVLDDRKVITDLSKLGLLDSALERFDKAIRQPHGMVILTGPTGSGKSTTLVAALHQVVSPEVNVLTVEDPVEYIIPGVRQIKLNTKLDLEDALRAILRHDPDVVMVGEMRDRKTAELAIKLANTGHLTFSTLHTNDAPAAVSRLYKMGIEPFLIAYAINLVVAQRLIRRLCPTCKQVDDDPDPVLLKQLGFSEEDIATGTFYKNVQDDSCPTCRGVGFKGRRAICEALYFSREVRHLIVESEGNLDEGAIRDLAVKQGMLTLRDSAREYVKLGETSVMEMIRVTSGDD
ncbi:MAG: GspE/PulE family protein [Bacteroidota bacterium]